MIIYIIEAVLVLTLVYVLFYVIKRLWLDNWLSGVGRNNHYWRGRPVNEKRPKQESYRPANERIEITLNGAKIGWMETGVIKNYGSFKDVMVDAYLIPNLNQPENLRFLGSFPSRETAHSNIEREFLRAQTER
jgi:hypothetical protein